MKKILLITLLAATSTATATESIIEKLKIKRTVNCVAVVDPRVLEECNVTDLVPVQLSPSFCRMYKYTFLKLREGGKEFRPRTKNMEIVPCNKGIK